MRFLIVIGVLLALGFSIPAIAADMYACRQANGVNAYQDTPCTKDQKQLAHAHYTPHVYAPPSSVPYGGVPQDPANAQPSPQGAESAPAQSYGYRASQRQASSRPAGYMCQAGKRQWMQLTPCPATYTRAETAYIDGIDVRTGAPVSGIGTRSVQAPVQSSPLDHNSMCANLRTGAVAVQHRGTSDVYERSVLKGKYCGG